MKYFRLFERMKLFSFFSFESMADIRSFFGGAPKESKSSKAIDKNKSKPKTKDSPKSSGPVKKAILPLPLPAPKSYFEYSTNDANHQDIPPNKDQVPIPEGVPNCMEGIIFSASGTMNSITRAQLRELIQKYGGKLLSKITDKTDVFIRGVDFVNRDKLEDARDRCLPIIDEAGFFYIIQKSNPEPPKPETKPNPTKVKPEIPPIVSKPEIKSTSTPQSNLLTTDSCPTTFTPSTSTSAILKPQPESQPIITKPPPPPSPDQLFTEKYRPTNFSELVGNEEGITKLRQFLKTFNQQNKKCVIIYGPPGIGKTTSAVICAKEAGFHVIEFNASDTRNKQSIEKIARDVFTNQTLFNFSDTPRRTPLRTCIIFDEVDGMSSGDRGGIQALSEFVKKSKIPIICICNDGYNKKLQPLKKDSLEIPFEAPKIHEIAQRLQTICDKEKITMNRQKYFTIINKSSGDIRSALNSLQLWVSGVESASEKDTVVATDPFGAITKLLKPKTTFEQRMECFFFDYESMPSYVHHYCTIGDGVTLLKYADALDSMAYGNEMDNLIHRDGAWELLNPLGVISTVIPATLCPKVKVYPSFPDDFSKGKKQNAMRRSLLDISLRCQRNCGSGTANSFRSSVADLILLQYLSFLENHQEEKALDMLDEFEMTEDDMNRLRELIDFGKNTFPEIDVSTKNRLSKLFKERHPALKKNYTNPEDERSDYLIKSSL